MEKVNNTNIDIIRPVTRVDDLNDKERVFREYYNDLDPWELNHILKTAVNAKKSGKNLEKKIFTPSKRANQMIVLNKKEFQESLSKLSVAVASNPVVPVVENVRIESNFLTLTNLNITIKIKVNCEGETEPFLMPYKKLFDYVKTLPDAPIQIIPDHENYKHKISCGDSKATLPGENIKDFPELPDIKNTQLEFRLSHLSDIGRKVCRFVDTDTIGGWMESVGVKWDQGQVVFFGTHGHRVSRYAIECDQSIKGITGLSREFSKLCNLFEDEVNLTIGDRNFKIENENLTAWGMVSDVEYKDCDIVIPKHGEWPYKVILKKSDLSNELKRSVLFSNYKTLSCSLVFENDSLAVESKDISYDTDYSGSIPCTLDVDFFVIGVKADYLLSMLEVCDSEEITIELKSHGSAMVIREDGFTGICMPMIIDDEKRVNQNPDKKEYAVQ